MAATQDETHDTATSCPIARAAKLFGDHWTLLILRDLEGGCRRFRATWCCAPRASRRERDG